MIEWHFLNFGSKKLKASIDTDIRITGVKTLHIGHAMSFVVNQREGLKGLCLKAGSVLLNVSENLSMAFFWPKKPTNLELVEDRDLTNGEQWLSSYPEEAYDIDLETEDLLENVLPLYHDTKDDERQDIVAGLNEKWRNSYAITELYDTAEKAQASCAWKFDHWRQFDYTDLDRVEFCFKPVFKLDRIKEYVHTNVGGDIQKTSEGYSENPNRNYGYGTQADYSRGGPIRDTYDGRVFYDVDYYRETTREEHFADTPGWYANGSIPTVDYYQIANRFEWYYNYVGYTVIHYCSHQTSYSGGWAVGADWNPYYGSRTTTLKGKEVVGPGNMDIDDMLPGFREGVAGSHPSKHMRFVIRLVGDYGYTSSYPCMHFNRWKLVPIGRRLTPDEINSCDRIFYEEDEKTVIDRAWRGLNQLNYDWNAAGVPHSKQHLVSYALPEAEDLYNQTLEALPIVDINMLYFNPISVDPSTVTSHNIDQLLAEGKISLAKEVNWKRCNGGWSAEDQKLRIATVYEGAHGFKYEDIPVYDIDGYDSLRDALNEFSINTIWKDFDSGAIRGRKFTQNLISSTGYFFNMKNPLSGPNCNFYAENMITSGGPDPNLMFTWWGSQPDGCWCATVHESAAYGLSFQPCATGANIVANSSYMYQLVGSHQPNTEDPNELWGCMATFIAEVRGWEGQPDSCYLKVDAIDTNWNNVYATTRSIESCSPNAWQTISCSLVVPNGTRILRVELHAGKSYFGTWYDAHMRNARLVVSSAPQAQGKPIGQQPWISVTEPRGGAAGRIYATGNPSSPRLFWTSY